tara:strand:- start:192 stop:461 length:270 start_codon:yes stop_codon:yes gene_type:complete
MNGSGRETRTWRQGGCSDAMKRPLEPLVLVPGLGTNQTIWLGAAYLPLPGRPLVQANDLMRPCGAVSATGNFFIEVDLISRSRFVTSEG